MDAIDTWEVGDVTVSLHQDTDVEDPRQDFDHFGTMATWHRRYRLGDEQPGQEPDEYLQELPKGSVILPLYLFDHSGLSIRTDSAPFRAFDLAGWDWGQVGVIFATPDTIRKEYGCKRISRQTRERVVKLLQGEVEEYDQYLTGDVYGYTVEDSEGNVLDSCWGFFGEKYAREEANAAAAHYATGNLLAA